MKSDRLFYFVAGVVTVGSSATALLSASVHETVAATTTQPSPTQFPITSFIVVVVGFFCIMRLRKSLFRALQRRTGSGPRCPNCGYGLEPAQYKCPQCGTRAPK